LGFCNATSALISSTFYHENYSISVPLKSGLIKTLIIRDMAFGTSGLIRGGTSVTVTDNTCKHIHSFRH